MSGPLAQSVERGANKGKVLCSRPIRTRFHFLFGLGMGRTWEKSELFSNFFVNISTFKVRPCFASPRKIPQIPQNQSKKIKDAAVYG